MFKRSPKDKAIIKELETRLDEATDIIRSLTARNTLIGIEHDGRMINFSFVCNGELILIQAIGTWSDDIGSWKKQLGIKP